MMNDNYDGFWFFRTFTMSKYKLDRYEQSTVHKLKEFIWFSFYVN